MKFKPISSLFKISIFSAIIQFVMIFNGYGNGGLAMAPFVFVPLVLIISIIVLIINIILKQFKIIMSPIYNYLTFTILVIVADFLGRDSKSFFSFFQNSENQLMLYPVLIGAFFLIIYEKRNLFLV